MEERTIKAFELPKTTMDYRARLITRCVLTHVPVNMCVFGVLCVLYVCGPAK